MVLFQSEGQQAQDPGRAAIWDPVQRKQRTDVLVRRQSSRKNSFLLRGGKRVALFRPHMIGSGPPALGRALALLSLRFKCPCRPQSLSQKHPDECLTEYLGMPCSSQVDA